MPLSLVVGWGFSLPVSSTGQTVVLVMTVEVFTPAGRRVSNEITCKEALIHTCGVLRGLIYGGGSVCGLLWWVGGSWVALGSLGGGLVNRVAGRGGSLVALGGLYYGVGWLGSLVGGDGGGRVGWLCGLVSRSGLDWVLRVNWVASIDGCCDREEREN